MTAPPLAGWARVFLAAAAFLGLLTVALGALAAHLPDRSFAPGGRAMLASAVQMQGWHVTALLAAGLLAWLRPRRLTILAGACFLVGLLCFCLGVDALAFGTSPMNRAVGHVAPTGGTILMLGWLLLAISLLRR